MLRYQKILILIDDDELSENVVTTIESYFDYQVIFANSLNKSIDLLINDDEITMVVTEYKSAEGTDSKLIQYNLENSCLPLCILAKQESNNKEALDSFVHPDLPHFLVALPFSEARFKKTLYEMIKGLDKAISKNVEYKKVRKSFVKKYKHLLPQTYIQESSKLYTCISPGQGEGISFSSDSGNEDFVYLEKSDFKNFIESVQLQIEASSADGDQSKLYEQLSSFMDEMEHFYNEFGIDKLGQEYIKKQVDSCIHAIKDDKKVAGVLNTFCSGRGYLVEHSVMALHISYIILKEFDLDKDEIVEKFVYAAITHDFPLSMTMLSPIIDIDSQEYFALSLNDKQKVKEHPGVMANILENSFNVSDDTIKIILEHHERPDGKGFPRGLNANNISSLSCIFIIALRAADNFCKSKSIDVVKEYFTSKSEEYTLGRFKRPYETFIQKLIQLL